MKIRSPIINIHEFKSPKVYRRCVHNAGGDEEIMQRLKERF